PGELYLPGTRTGRWHGAARGHRAHLSAAPAAARGTGGVPAQRDPRRCSGNWYLARVGGTTWELNIHREQPTQILEEVVGRASAQMLEGVVGTGSDANRAHA